MRSASQRWWPGSRALLRAVVPALTLLSAPGCSDKSPPPRPATNVLLITMDTTRADYLGCYGRPGEVTPNLDALAAEGVRFTHAVSASALTPVSHASIFTGLYPHEHGLRVFYGAPGYYLSANTPTLASILKQHGYRTAAFVSAFPASERFGLQWGFDLFQSGVDRSDLSVNPQQEVHREELRQQDRYLRERHTIGQRRGDVVAEEALAWLAHAEAPFFLWVHFFDPHDPSLIPPEEYTEKFGVRRLNRDARTPLYEVEVNFMDAQIGRLLQRLRERGFYDDSLIAVVSDHGQGLGDHGWYQHRLLYREQIWVPLILRVPDGPRGVERSPLVRSIDILPTIADYLSIDPPAEVTGRSLRNVLNGVPDLPDAPRVAYAEALVRLDTHSNLAFPKKWNDLLFCVMDRDWKLIYHRDKPENSELYDLRNDPKELKNVIDQYADQKNRLMQILEKTGGLVVQEKETAPIDQETQKRLQALGYIGDDGG